MNSTSAVDTSTQAVSPELMVLASTSCRPASGAGAAAGAAAASGAATGAATAAAGGAASSANTGALPSSAPAMHKVAISFFILESLWLWRVA